MSSFSQTRVAFSATEPDTNSGSDRFIACGLGSLGQHYVANLRAFGVEVTAVDLVLPSVWELPNLPTLLTDAIAADCCQGSVLERAGSDEAAFEGANAIARFTGCSLSEARDAMKHLPAVIPMLLYLHQAQQLVRILSRCRVRAHLITKAQPSHPTTDC